MISNNGFLIFSPRLSTLQIPGNISPTTVWIKLCTQLLLLTVFTIKYMVILVEMVGIWEVLKLRHLTLFFGCIIARSIGSLLYGKPLTRMFMYPLEMTPV